jgi:hypothetical protein
MKKISIKKVGVSSSKMDTILNKSRYKSALEQYLLDTHQIVEEFGEVGRQKMEMGKVMEPIIKDLVEKNLNVKLTVDKERYCHDEISGFTIEFDALDYNNNTVYEFKNTEKDEKNILRTYYAQVQFAMYMINWDKARICYLKNGWELGYIDVKRDDNFIKNMIKVGLYYLDCLENRIQPDLNYIDIIVNDIKFYKGEENMLKGAGVSLEFNQDEVELLYKWRDIKGEIDRLEFEEQRIKGIFSEKYGKYNDSVISYSNVENLREGGIDIGALIKDHPSIDFRKYRKDDTKFARQVLRVKKKREEEKVIIKETEDIV